LQCVHRLVPQILVLWASMVNEFNLGPVALEHRCKLSRRAGLVGNLRFAWLDGLCASCWTGLQVA